EKPVLDKRLGLLNQIENTIKLDDIKNLYTKVQEEVERVHDEQKILTLKMDRHIAKYIGISDPNFIAIIVEEKILIEEKLEDGKISSVKDGIKGDYFPLNKKRIIDNIDDTSTKKKMDNRIRVAEMTLNESELKVLSGEILKEVENKAVLLYTECGYLDYGVEDTKEMISLFNKKEKFFKDKTDKGKEPVLKETLVLKANLNIEDKDQMVVDSGYNNIKLDLQMRLTLWNLLTSSKLAKIRHCFSHFEKIAATEWRDFDKTRAVFVKGNQDLNNLEGEEINNNTGKKELDHLWDIIQNAIIKAANQMLPKKKILNT
ncbi:37073_t:CDS:2, partial [Gigaspora margarita]